MTEVPVPTRQEVVDLLLAVLEGTTSRLVAAEWAQEMQENIENEDFDGVDPEMWHLMRLAATLDVPFANLGCLAALPLLFRRELGPSAPATPRARDTSSDV